MTLKILVTGGGGQVAQGVLYSLENTNLDIEIFLTGNDPFRLSSIVEKILYLCVM